MHNIWGRILHTVWRPSPKKVNPKKSNHYRGADAFAMSIYVLSIFSIGNYIEDEIWWGSTSFFASTCLIHVLRHRQFFVARVVLFSNRCSGGGQWSTLPQKLCAKLCFFNRGVHFTHPGFVKTHGDFVAGSIWKFWRRGFAAISSFLWKTRPPPLYAPPKYQIIQNS